MRGFWGGSTSNFSLEGKLCAIGEDKVRLGCTRAGELCWQACREGQSGFNRQDYIPPTPQQHQQPVILVSHMLKTQSTTPASALALCFRLPPAKHKHCSSKPSGQRTRWTVPGKTSEMNGQRASGAAFSAPPGAVVREKEWERTQNQPTVTQSAHKHAGDRSKNHGCLPLFVPAVENHLGGAELSCSSFISAPRNACDCISLIQSQFGTEKP